MEQNRDELYHYGIPGMKWGVRKARKQLANLTGRNREKISDAEAEKFRSDVKSAKKMKDKNTREQWVKSVSGKGAAGKKYADAVLTQVKNDKVKSMIKGPAIAAGTIAAYPFLALGVSVLGQGVSAVGKAVAPVVKPVGKAIGKTLFWWK